MQIANIHEAKTQLSRLVERALRGRGDHHRAGRQAVGPPRCDSPDAKRLARAANGKGRSAFAEDFDDLPEEVARAFGIDVP